MRRTKVKSKDRYAENWRVISLNAKQMTKGRCCYPGCNSKAQETHHVCYLEETDEGLIAIASQEEIGIHVFPLCKYHHSDNPGCAHHITNWRRDRGENTPEFYELLRKGWAEKVYAVKHQV